jgi:hypothetical protein
MKTITKFEGYNSRVDATKLKEGYLVSGSQNVLSTDGENIKIREGYELLGAASTDLTPIESSYDWATHSAVERNLRSYDDKLEVYYGGVWTEIADSFTAVDFEFAEWWDADEEQDVLLFVNGTPNIYAWSGGITTIASATANTITKNGTTTWAEDRFLTTANYGDRKVVINGTEYTYTGGEGTTTLTGVTPDPSGEAEDSLAIQSVNTIANKPASGVNNDLISVLNNQLYISDSTKRDVYICKQNDFNTWTSSSPRLPGEAAVLTLDGFPKAYIIQEEFMYISGGTDEWYKVLFELSSDGTKESVNIKRLKTSSNEAAISQGAVCNIKNDVAFVTQENGIDTLGRLENIDTPRSKPISDPIKTELAGYNTTNIHTKYFRNNIYIALPSESLVLIYNLEKGYWEAPQTLPIRRLAIIGGNLCGHSNAVPETYTLFTTLNDNGNPIDAIAAFSYLQYGERDLYKSLDEWYSEGYISSGTKLTLQLNIDYDGATSNPEYIIDGSDESILFNSTKNIGIGKSKLGDEPLGSTTDDIDTTSKFRQIDTMVKQDFFEIQPIYKTNQVDADWKLLAFGSNVTYSPNKPITIKK